MNYPGTKYLASNILSKKNKMTDYRAGVREVENEIGIIYSARKKGSSPRMLELFQKNIGTMSSRVIRNKL